MSERVSSFCSFSSLWRDLFSSWAPWMNQGRAGTMQPFCSWHMLLLICWLMWLMCRNTQAQNKLPTWISFSSFNSWARHLGLTLWQRAPASTGQTLQLSQKQQEPTGFEFILWIPAYSWSHLPNCLICGCQAPAADVKTTALQRLLT